MTIRSNYAPAHCGGLAVVVEEERRPLGQPVRLVLTLANPGDRWVGFLLDRYDQGLFRVWPTNGCVAPGAFTRVTIDAPNRPAAAPVADAIDWIRLCSSLLEGPVEGGWVSWDLLDSLHCQWAGLRLPIGQLRRGRSGRRPSQGRQLAVAAASGDRETVQKLLRSCQRSVPAITEWRDLYHLSLTPTWVAAYNGHTAVVEALLAAGADVDAGEERGATPLWVAAQNGHVELVESLIAHGADIHAGDTEGATPLWLASQNGHDRIVTALLEAGASPDKAAEDGASPLFAAAKYGHSAVVAALLSAGANPSLPMQGGNTPLSTAAQGGYLGVVELLLRHGADLGAATAEGLTPLWLAAAQGHAEVVQRLLQASPSWPKALPGRAPGRRLVCGKEGIRMGSCAGVSRQVVTREEQVNAANVNGATPLFVAAQDGHATVTRLLLTAGADPNITRQDGCSPLLVAAYYGFLQVVKLLLRAGADPNKADPRGFSPLYCAADQGHDIVVGALLRAGAKVDAAADTGTTPLIAAAGRGHERVALLLQGWGADAGTGDCWGCAASAAQGPGHDRLAHFLKSAAEGLPLLPYSLQAVQPEALALALQAGQLPLALQQLPRQAATLLVTRAHQRGSYTITYRPVVAKYNLQLDAGESPGAAQGSARSLPSTEAESSSRRRGSLAVLRASLLQECSFEVVRSEGADGWAAHSGASPSGDAAPAEVSPPEEGRAVTSIARELLVAGEPLSYLLRAALVDEVVGKCTLLGRLVVGLPISRYAQAKVASQSMRAMGQLLLQGHLE